MAVKIGRKVFSMSQEDFKKVKQRLEQAKQEIAWVLAVVHDQDSNLEGYDLSIDEKEQIVQESLQGMTELLLPLSQQLAKHPKTPIESVTLEQMEHLHLSQYDFKKVVKSDHIIRIELVGPGGPPRRGRSSKNRAADTYQVVSLDGPPRRSSKNRAASPGTVAGPGGPPRRRRPPEI
jgi:hypothetical protein